MRTIFAFAIAFLLAACSKSPADGLEIPDHVKHEKTREHIQLPGTRLFVVSPRHFQFDRNLIRFIKPDSAMLMFMEIKGQNFIEGKARTVDSINKIKETGMRPYLDKTFKIGPYEALFIYANDTDDKLDLMMLMMGDKTTTVMVAGKLLRGDIKMRDELLKSMLSVYVDENAEADFSKLETYTIDSENSPFKYIHHQSQLTIYSTAAGNPMQDAFGSYAMGMGMPAMSTNEKKQYALSMIDRYKNNGIEITRIVYQRETGINGMPSFEILAEGRYQGKNNKIYQLVTGDLKNTVLFSGITYTDHDRYIDEYKKMGATIQMKTED